MHTQQAPQIASPKAFLFGVAAMAAIVLLSNVLVQFLLGSWLTWGALTYPIAFLITDLMNRFYGPAVARKVVAVGFVVGLVCSAIGTQIMLEFGPAVTTRIALASGIAFLCAQLVDIQIFDRLRSSSWWQAPLLSSLIGSALDTALFFTIAFSGMLSTIFPGVDVAWTNEAVPFLGAGPVLPLWVSLALADFMVKICLALIALGPYNALVTKTSPATTP